MTKGTIAIVAALPGELKPLVSPAKGVRWQRLKPGKLPESKGTVLWERRHAGGRWIAGCSGMGGSRALVALREIERYCADEEPVAAICSVGWVGALDMGIAAGSAWRIAQVIDTQTGERFLTAQHRQGETEEWPLLATTAHVADGTEKARLAAAYGAKLVDMEAATLARMAQARGIPFFCMKAVSDSADAKLPEMNRFMMANGQLHMVPFLAHVAMRPGSWQGLIRLGRYSALAAQHLAKAMQAWLDEDISAT